MTAPSRRGQPPRAECSSAGTNRAHCGRSASRSASLITASSGRHSGCSVSRTVSRDPLVVSEAIWLTPRGFGSAADEGTLPYADAMRSRPVIHFGAGVDLDYPARMVADIGPRPTATLPGGLGARAAESDSGHEQHYDRTPAAHHVSWSEEKMMTARRISPPRRTSAGRMAHRQPREGDRHRRYKGSAIPPSTIPARRKPQPFSQTVATRPSEAISAAITTASRTSTDASKRSSASMLSSDAPPQDPTRIKSVAAMDAAENKKDSTGRVVAT